MLAENSPCPQFSCTDHTGKTRRDTDLKGRGAVLFFYPKDNTPGCTIEACSFREHYAAFKDLGVEIYGISRDTQASHQKFAAKQDLPFPLLADTKSQICDAFGVIKEKSMFGKTYFGIVRSTFFFNDSGVIIKVWTKVSPSKHVPEVLEFARSYRESQDNDATNR